MRIVHGEEDRWESRDHAYSQGLIDGAEQASIRLRDIKDAESPPQVTVNPPGGVRGGSLALLALLIGAGLAALFFLNQGSGGHREAPQQTIEQYFGEDPTGEPTPVPEPSGVPESDAEAPGVDAPAVSSQEPAGEPGTAAVDAGTGIDPAPSSDAPVDPVPAPEAPAAPAPANPAPAPPVVADPEPPAPQPTPTPTPRQGVVSGLVTTVDDTVGGTLGVVDGLVCGLLCP